jgi:hypothetical protein
MSKPVEVEQTKSGEPPAEVKEQVLGAVGEKK